MSTPAKRWYRGRKTPYSVEEIERAPCVRCGAPACHQWQVCADNRLYRALCLDCDILLNRLVLAWANDPRAKEKCDAYEVRERAIEEKAK